MLEAAGVACAGGDAAKAFRALASREWLGLDGMVKWFGSKPSAAIHASWIESDGLTQSIKVTSRTTVRVGEPIRGKLLQAARIEGATGEFDSFSVRMEGERHLPNNSTGMFVLDGYSLVDEDGFAGWNDGHQEKQPFSMQKATVERPAGAKRRLNAPRFSSQLRSALTAIKQAVWYDDFFEYLKVVRPNLLSIESIAVGERDEPHMFEGPPRVNYPIAYAGDGFRRALLLAATLAEAKGGIAALDEPEAYAHPRMHDAIARMLRRAIDDGTQVLIATHSLEFVEKVLESFKGDPERTSVLGLRRIDGAIDALVVEGPDAYRRVVELSDDLRL